ncbi:MAG: glycerate kinase [Anaerolineaceae bacterium]|nr:glycerate kinase [Anaerolineaceae bacterium]
MSMRIIVAPGAFKNSLTAQEAATAIARGLEQSGLGADLALKPVADGGNGTLDAMLAGGGERRSRVVSGPLGAPVQADWGLLPDGKTAVVEMALASGMELLAPDELDPLRASTFGTGQLLAAALEAGATRVILGLGGSATVDGGAGCLQALGVQLLDARGEAIGSGGAQLGRLTCVDAGGLDPRWRDTSLLLASDVDNPALGQQGAAAVFGPQKGADAQQVATLEAQLSHFFTVIHEQTGRDLRQAPGGGAAGAFAAGMMAFLDAELQPGIELVLAHSGFEEALADVDLVITGEGQMDEQTIHGKGPIGVARMALARGVPTVALVGGLAVHDTELHRAGMQAVLPITPGPMALEEALAGASQLLERAALRLGYLLQTTSPPG